MNYYEDIKNQEDVINLLQNQLKSEHVSHAYLFVGGDSTVQKKTALAFAKSQIINGIEQKRQLDEAQRENICRRIDKEIYPDVHVIEPQGAATYLVDQIKNVVNDVVLAPIESTNKIYIITSAQNMNSASANAILKTLEEPPANVCFILLANNKENVLSTITSRCQTLQFNQLPYDDALALIQKEGGCSTIDAVEAYSLFGGDTSKAVQYCLDQDEQDLVAEINFALDEIDNLSDWQILTKSKDVVQKIKESTDTYKKHLETTLKDLSEVLEHAAISDIEKQNKRLVQAKQKEMLYLFCSAIQFYFKKQIDNCADAKRAIARMNVVSKFIDTLAYNISAQNFCDCVFLELKRI